jgi:hypothetical protein
MRNAITPYFVGGFNRMVLPAALDRSRPKKIHGDDD